MPEQQEIVREFLLESNENLDRLDQDIVELERRPDDKNLIAGIFRTVHTIKGTCGFLGFGRLERVAHQLENILSRLRSGDRQLTPELAALVLRGIDSIREILTAIESTGTEGSGDYDELIHILETAFSEEKAVRQAGPAPRSEPEKNGSAAETAIRVDVVLLDKLMNLVGELVLARNQVLQFNMQNEDGVLNATSQRLDLITTELQESVMKTRMQPIGVVWNKLPRLVRDVAYSCGKQIELEMEGSETELDKTIIEAIKDPLTHLVRNCCSHGIETPTERVRRGKTPAGTVSLRAYHEGGQVNIEISDDGGGIDVALLKQKALEKGLIKAEQAERMTEREGLHLIFLAGLSTARAVTNVCGRGVGMDVVRSNIERIGGVVEVLSRLTAGTTIKLKIPLTLAIIPGLVVTSGGERFVIPQASLLELIRLDGDTAAKIEYVHGTPVCRRRGKLLPIAFLNEVLKLRSHGEAARNIVVLQAEDHQFGLVVDGIKDTQEIVVKPLGKQLKGLAVYAGATIMGDGRVALILDVPGIGEKAAVMDNHREQSRNETQTAAQTLADCERLLLFRAGTFTRVAVPLAVVARLEEFPRSALERAGGRYVVQYRGGILPVLALSSVLEPDTPGEGQVLDPVPVIVFADGARGLGVMVDEIVDIVEEPVQVRERGDRHGLLGSGIVGKLVTDFLDVRAVIESTSRTWLHQGRTGDAPAVLLAEPSPFVRGVLRCELEISGYRVIEAASAAEAMERLRKHKPAVVLAALDLPPQGCAALHDEMRRDPDLAVIPTVGLAASREEAERQRGTLDDCQMKADCSAMLASIQRLAAAVAHPAPVERPVERPAERKDV
ncbi:MAG TPA: chemotaxis protein CheW [Bryobacteraceae bacterium]|nr:chemotaxis protein CheW [Bryobacteraceae bacterium]